MSQQVPLLKSDLNQYDNEWKEDNQQTAVLTSQDSFENIAFNTNQNQQFFPAYPKFQYLQDYEQIDQELSNQIELEELEIQSPRTQRLSSKPIEQHIKETKDQNIKLVKQQVLACFCCLLLIAITCFVYLWVISKLAITFTNNFKEDLQKYFYNN